MLKVLTEIWNQLCSLNNSSIRLVVGSHCYVCNSSIVHVVTKEGDFRVCKRIITRSCWIVWKGQHAIITIHATFLPLCPIALDCVVSSILAIIWNWKLFMAGIPYLETQFCPMFFSKDCMDSYSSCFIARLACDGAPCQHTSFFVTLLIKSFISVLFVGLPNWLISFHFIILFGIYAEIAFFQNLELDLA